MRIRRLVAVLFAIAVVAGSLLYVLRRQEPIGPTDVLVLCGGSMRTAMDEIAANYREKSPDRILMTYGGSGDMIAQLQQTQRGDILVCHDPFMPWAAERGMIDEWAAVAEMEAVIVVPRDNPKAIAGLEDLARPGVRLGSGDRVYSTAGYIVTSIITNAPFGPALEANIIAESKGHSERCAEVAMGALDAGIVWNGVAHAFRDRLLSIPIPKTYIDSVTSATYQSSDLRHVQITVGVTSHARERAAARRFYEFVLASRDVFVKHGFSPIAP